MSADEERGGWLRRMSGMDGFDLILHTLITAGLMAYFLSEGDTDIVPIVFTGSAVVLAVRRHFAMRRLAQPHEGDGLTSGEMAAVRFEELERRLSELEERADFAERLLAESNEPTPVPGD